MATRAAIGHCSLNKMTRWLAEVRCQQPSYSSAQAAVAG